MEKIELVEENELDNLINLEGLWQKNEFASAQTYIQRMVACHAPHCGLESVNLCFDIYAKEIVTTQLVRRPFGLSSVSIFVQ